MCDTVLTVLFATKLIVPLYRQQEIIRADSGKRHEVDEGASRVLTPRQISIGIVFGFPPNLLPLPWRTNGMEWIPGARRFFGPPHHHPNFELSSSVLMSLIQIPSKATCPSGIPGLSVACLACLLFPSYLRVLFLFVLVHVGVVCEWRRGSVGIAFYEDCMFSLGKGAGSYASEMWFNGNF